MKYARKNDKGKWWRSYLGYDCDNCGYEGTLKVLTGVDVDNYRPIAGDLVRCVECRARGVMMPMEEFDGEVGVVFDLASFEDVDLISDLEGEKEFEECARMEFETWAVAVGLVPEGALAFVKAPADPWQGEYRVGWYKEDIVEMMWQAWSTGAFHCRDY